MTTTRKKTVKITHLPTGITCTTSSTENVYASFKIKSIVYEKLLTILWLKEHPEDLDLTEKQQTLKALEFGVTIQPYDYRIDTYQES